MNQTNLRYNLQELMMIKILEILLRQITFGEDAREKCLLSALILFSLDSDAAKSLLGDRSFTGVISFSSFATLSSQFLMLSTSPISKPDHVPLL